MDPAGRGGFHSEEAASSGIHTTEHDGGQVSTFEVAIALLTSAISAETTGDAASMYLELSCLLEDTTPEDLQVILGGVLGLAAAALVTQTVEPLTYFRNLAQAYALDGESDKMTS